MTLRPDLEPARMTCLLYILVNCHHFSMNVFQNA